MTEQALVRRRGAAAQSLAEAVVATATRHGERVAVDTGAIRLTYADLVERSSAVAAWFARQGVEPRDNVCIVADKDPGVYPCVLGALMAGAAYVPLDPTAPPARVRELVDRVSARALVVSEDGPVDSGGRAVLGTGVGQPESNGPTVTASVWSLPPAPDAPLPETRPDDLAYVVFTSGSTGRPKGVLVEHGAVANLVSWIVDEMEVREGSRLTQSAPLFFDASVQQIFSAWSAGAALVPVPDDVRTSGTALLDWLRRNAITHWDSIPTFWSRVVRAARDDGRTGSDLLPALEVVLLAGEVLPAADVNEWAPWRRGHRLFNVYGPTEATVDATRYEVRGPVSEATVPIGRAIPGMSCHVSAGSDDPGASTDEGELYLSGAGLARGYLDDPEETARRFVDVHGTRAYRTGDIVRKLPSGHLVYAGRIDDQIKVNGVRIEPSEVEEVLRRHPAVDEAVVVQALRADGTTAVVGAVARAYDTVTSEALRQHARAHLPLALVPTVVVPVNALPATANGKLDRRGCREIVERSLTEAAAPPSAPSTRVEDELLRIASEFLGHALSPDEDLFAAGADSITTIRLRQEAARAGIVFGPGDVFSHPTVRRLALHASVQRTPDGATDRATAERALPAGIIPLLPAQRGILATTLIAGDGIQRGLVQEVDLYRGALDLDALRAALDVVVERHEALQVAFEGFASGEPVQRLHDDVAGDLRIADVSADTLDEHEAAVASLARDVLERGVDLSRPPLLGLTVARSRAATSLVWTMHHLVTDGWSWDVLHREVAELYESLSGGAFRPLPDPSLGLAGLAGRLTTLPDAEGVAVAADRLRDAVALRLPRPASGGTDYAREEISFVVPPAVHRRVRDVATALGVTESAAYVAAVAAGLGAAAGERSFAVGLISSGRNLPIDGIESVVAPLARTVPVVVATEGRVSREALTRLHDEIALAIALDRVDVDAYLRAEGIPPDVRAPAVTIAVQNYGVRAAAGAPEDREPQLEAPLRSYASETAASPLTVVVHETTGDTRGVRIEYWQGSVTGEFAGLVLREIQRGVRRVVAL